jgi:PadR family transcriptional regulator PadR
MPNACATSPLGEFEQVVLLAILGLDDDAYGVTIRRRILECTGRSIAPGSLYNTLDRLEEKGLLASRFGDPSPQRGGRAKRLYQVSAIGIAAIAHAQKSFQRLLKGVALPGVAHA